MISYNNLLSNLIFMDNNNREVVLFQANNKENNQTLKIIKKLGNYKYEFRIDNGFKIVIIGKKSFLL